MSDVNKILLQTILNDLMEDNISLLTPMNKLYLFALKTKNLPLRNYISHEINGYDSETELPDYRKSLARLFIVLHTDEHLEVPASLVEIYGEAIQYTPIRENISTVEMWYYESLKTNADDGLKKTLPLQMLPEIHLAACKTFGKSRINIKSAYLFTAISVACKIRNTVRMRMMDLVHGMAESFGLEIEFEIFSQKLESNNQIINNIMNKTITINGDGNVANTGDNSKLNVDINIGKGDLEKLNEQLRKLGINPEDIDELNAMIAVQPQAINNRIPDEINGWIGKTFARLLSLGGDIASGAVGGVLATLIQNHYGVHS